MHPKLPGGRLFPVFYKAQTSGGAGSAEAGGATSKSIAKKTGKAAAAAPAADKASPAKTAQVCETLLSNALVEPRLIWPPVSDTSARTITVRSARTQSS